MRFQYHTLSKQLSFAIAFSVVSSASILACAFMGANEDIDKILKVIFPIVFWLGLVGEQVNMWMANKTRKDIESNTKHRKIRAKPGISSIMQTDSGAIADITCVISLIVLIILMIIGVGEKVVQFIFIFLLVLSFRLHCILNGKNFRYKKYLSMRKVDKDE